MYIAHVKTILVQYATFQIKYLLNTIGYRITKKNKLMFSITKYIYQKKYFPIYI